ncbi:MAG: hypothetical protein QOG54_2603 [Actinomycetota bacterium]|jgi:2'-hydroxyisoflavone reductase|nr:hypothetical protein [Actinomycetota bacterium]
MKVLVIGGTVFVGRNAVEVALERGDEVTLFNRGLHNADLFPDVPKLRGDRRADVSALEGTSWDVVIDTSAFQLEDVALVTKALAGSVERYVFVSSASVYRNWPAEPVDETSPVWKPGDGDNDYGIGKAQCEEAFEAAMPGRVIHARAAIITGPYENIGRLPYWLDRLSTYDDVIAPGSPDRSIQLLDARDLSNWMLVAAEAGSAGVYNVAGPPAVDTIGDLIDGVMAATGSSAKVEWVDDAFLLERGVEPWTELPLWLPPEGAEHGWNVPIDRAVETGLVNRPLADTIDGTWAWLEIDPSSEREPSPFTTLERSKEEELLREWTAS